MKRLKTSDITTSIAMPVKAGTLEFLQDASKETTQEIVKNLFGFAPDTDTVYILSGLVNSNTAPSYNVSAGTVYLNGEIYQVNAFNFTLTGLQKAYPRIETTQFLINADPVQFTDGIVRNVHDIRKIVIENTTVDSGIAEFKDFVLAGAWQYGDTKEIVCDSVVLARDFDGTGLGRLGRKGWAIMNSNNGTPDDAGRVVVAWGTGYTTLGEISGSKDAVVVEHKHNSIKYTDGKSAINDSGSGGLATGYPEISAPDGNGYINETSETGVSGIDKNMQPYVVRLRIMKVNA